MIQLDDLLAAGGHLVGDAGATHFSDIAYDSRLAQPGELFLALRTPRADGHDYIPAALAAGVAGVICAWPPPAAPGMTLIQAGDPLALIQRWAARRLHQVAPQVIAVTGSVGKTSTRHAIATLFGSHTPTFQSRGSFNSLLGLPIAIAQLRDQDRIAVLEFGADGFGEIAQLAALFPPHGVVITAIGAAHLAVFGSLDGVAREKGALLDALPPNGWAVLNGDDPHILALRKRTVAQVMTIGKSQGCDLRAERVEYTLHGTHLRLCWQGKTLDATTQLLGEPAPMIALAAVGAALAAGMAFPDAVAALQYVPQLPGRLHRLVAQSGATLLDDSYSAAPPAVLAALRTLAALPARRRIAILGEPEADHQGKHASEGQTNIATLIGSQAATAADLLICKGDWGAEVVRAARQAQPAIAATIAHTSTGVLQELPADMGPGDLVLIKGGAGARLERVVAGLLNHNQEPAQVLARQGAGWRMVRVGVPDRPTWVQIDLDAIGSNIRRLRAIAGVPLMAILKADAYGHGAVRTARTALANGASMLAVATLGEARVLREAGITGPILVLGYTPPWQAREAISLRVTCTLFDFEAARAWGAATNDLNTELSVHIKLDTGMARLGLAPEQAGSFLHMLSDMPRLRVEGLYTHFASADSPDLHPTRQQLERFRMALHEITAAGLRPLVVHAANSAALLRFPEARFDMVRPGIACYGLNPAPEAPLPDGFLPALAFYSEIAQVHSLPPGAPVSYGGRYVTQRPSQIATIPVGYADGLRRSPAWREVLVRGMRVPVVGRICMDYAMVDVTGTPGVKRGDPVVLIGAQGQERITADEVAGWLGTINYEVVSTILPRVPREVDQ